MFKVGSRKCKTTAIARDNDHITCRNEHTPEVFLGRSDARVLEQKMKQDTKTHQAPVNSINIANCLQSVSEKNPLISSSLPINGALN